MSQSIKPNASIVIYTGERDGFCKEEAYKQGISAYLNKGITHEEDFIEVIRLVSTGEIIQNTKAVDKRHNSLHERLLHQASILQENEKKIILKISEGKSSKQIAGELNYSKTAVDKILSRLRMRFGVHKNTELIMKLLNL